MMWKLHDPSRGCGYLIIYKYQRVQVQVQHVYTSLRIHIQPNRHQLAAFFDTTRHFQIQVLHIPRIYNFRAHNCATNVNFLDPQDSPKLACCNSDHAGEHCPTLMKLGNLQMKDSKITD